MAENKISLFGENCVVDEFLHPDASETTSYAFTDSAWKSGIVMWGEQLINYSIIWYAGQYYRGFFNTSTSIMEFWRRSYTISSFEVTIGASIIIFDTDTNEIKVGETIIGTIVGAIGKFTYNSITYLYQLNTQAPLYATYSGSGYIYIFAKNATLIESPVYSVVFGVYNYTFTLKGSGENSYFNSYTVAYSAGEMRAAGESSGVALSQKMNTVLRQTSFMSYIIAEILTQRYGLEITTGIDKTSLINSVNGIIAHMVENGFVIDNEITTNKIINNAITADKLAEGIVKNDMTVGKAKNISYDYLSGGHIIEKTISVNPTADLTNPLTELFLPTSAQIHSGVSTLVDAYIGVETKTILNNVLTSGTAQTEKQINTVLLKYIGDVGGLQLGTSHNLGTIDEGHRPTSEVSFQISGYCTYSGPGGDMLAGLITISTTGVITLTDWYVDTGVHAYWRSFNITCGYRRV